MESNSPRLSVDRIMENFLVDRDFVISLLEEALVSLRNEMGKLKKAVNENSGKDIESVAHTIKGVSLNLYLEDLPVLCKKLELGSGAAPDDIKRLFSEVEEEFLEVEKEIREVVKSHSA